MRIPLPHLMRNWREKEFEQHLTPAAMRSGIRFWAYAARHPRLYRWGARLAARVLGNLGRDKGRITSLPMASGWTRFRDLPAPQGRTFLDQWRDRRGGVI